MKHRRAICSHSILQARHTDPSQIPPSKWHHLQHRSLQTHPSPLTASNTLLLPANGPPLPSWLSSPVVDRFHALNLFTSTPHAAPNHVLLNEYNPGEGIMPHEDGDAYAPIVATVSLCDSLCLDIYSKPSITDDGEASRRPITRILQEPRSLLVTTGHAYETLLHGIANVEKDEDLSAETIANWDLLGDKTIFEGGVNVREKRISLTYRDVLKVSSAASKIFGKPKR